MMAKLLGRREFVVVDVMQSPAGLASAASASQIDLRSVEKAAHSDWSTSYSPVLSFSGDLKVQLRTMRLHWGKYMAKTPSAYWNHFSE
jgi:hypothetical protein